VTTLAPVTRVGRTRAGSGSRTPALLPHPGSRPVEWRPEVGNGVTQDFTEFVESRSQTLWRAAWLLTGDASLAEDLLQTALAKTWPHYAKVSRTGSYEAYVRRTIFTTYASWWQRKWRGEVPTEHLPERAGRGDDVDLSLDVRTALAHLSPKQRAVVVLRYFEDLTEAETAVELGCSVGSVKTHHSRALARLRASGLLERIGSRT
jgi:RNA polymerase sigma-70 factor (sigma-E family)